MKLRDYMDAFNKSLRANPKRKEIPNIAEISRRAALGESWAKLAFENGVSPRLIALRVREYRYANLATDAVLEDIRIERDGGKDWLELATRAGWPLKGGASRLFASEFTRLMNAKVESEPKKKRRGGGGRPKKVLAESSYEDYCAGRKTLQEIADENNMSIPTARKRLLELAGPDVTDIRSIVKAEPLLEPDEAEEIIEEYFEGAESPTDIVAHGKIPNGFWDRREILDFAYDEDTEREEVTRAYGLSDLDLDILMAIDTYSWGRIRALEEVISDISTEIDAAVLASYPEVVSAPPRVRRPKPAPVEVEEAPEPVTIADVLPQFEKREVPKEKKRRGRKKKVYNFSDAEREFIRSSYYDDGKYVFVIADALTKQRGENVTQVAVKEVIADYSLGRGRRSTIDRAALERDARRNLAVSTLAEMHNVSGPTIAKYLKEMGIQPIYSREKEARLRKRSAEEIAEHQRRLKEIDDQVLMILNDPTRRQTIKDAYLRSDLIGENDVAVLAASHGLSTYNMARVLTDIFEDEIRRIRNQDRVADLAAKYGADQLRKIQRDLIDRRTLQLRGNPYDETALNRYVVPGAQGAAAGLVVDQALRHFYPDMGVNTRNAASGAVVVSACAADYLYEKDEKKLWRAAGGVAGVLISRLIESKFQTKG
jgi:hypothetical protein